MIAPAESPASAHDGSRPTGRWRALVVVGYAYAGAGCVALAVGWLLRGQPPLLVAAAADLAATVVIFGFSVAFDNSSLYDPYWSLAPIPIALYWLSLSPGATGPRQLLALSLVCLWGLRLTGNWVARWRGLSDEDFRYAEIRAKTGRGYWPASFIGIHLMPTLWVFLGLLPLFPVLSGTGRPLGFVDLAASIVTAGAIAIEGISDLQLRRFLRTRADPSDVLQTGLWGLCRHPNYLGEVLFWWGLYLFGLAADPAWFWSGIGAISITVLFVAVSIPWMDRRMLSRHPKWVDRMSTAPALIPFTKFR